MVGIFIENSRKNVKLSMEITVTNEWDLLSLVYNTFRFRLKFFICITRRRSHNSRLKRVNLVLIIRTNKMVKC